MSSEFALLNSRTVDIPWRILLVSDSLLDQKFLPGLLQKHQHQVVVVSDARKALARCTDDQFDAVILDAMLPAMEGPDLISGIRQLKPDGCHVPIVLLADDRSDCERGMAAGASACLYRPFQLVEFHECVRAIRRPFGEPQDAGHSESDSVDWPLALEAVGGRRDLLAELIEIFSAEYPETLVAIRNAIDAADAKRLQMAAHQLKGCLRYFGTTAASELARKLEDIGRSGKVDGAAIMIEPLFAAVEHLVPQLQRGPE